MDISINALHRILLDAALPSTLEDLKNPTEDYIVNLLTTFLSRFCIDVNLIDKLISEQHTTMMYYEDSDAINLINLHAVVTQIFDKIFICDFCLTDITSPGQKRLRRHAKFLSNFVLYTMHKKLELNERMDQVQETYRLMEELKEKKTQVLESINNKALHKAKQLSFINKFESDIQQMQLKIETDNKREMELKVMKNDVEREHQKAKEVWGSVKSEVGKLSKVIVELQSEVVHSPEEFQSRLNELEEQKNLKMEDRDVMQENIQEKKQIIKQIEEELNLIQSINSELTAFKDTYNELKDEKAKSDDIKKQIDSLNNNWNELQIKLTKHKDQVDTEINEVQSRLEKDITSLSNSFNQLLSEIKVQRNKLEANQVLFNERNLMRNKLQADIQKKEEDTIAFLQTCQEMYDNEIFNELELRKGEKDK